MQTREGVEVGLEQGVHIDNHHELDRSLDIKLSRYGDEAVRADRKLASRAGGSRAEGTSRA